MEKTTLFNKMKELAYTDMAERLEKVNSSTTFEELLSAFRDKGEVLPTNFHCTLQSLVDAEENLRRMENHMTYLLESIKESIEMNEKD